MKKVLYALICMMTSGSVFGLEIRLDPKTSNYPLSVSIYTPDAKTLIIHDAINKDEKSTRYALNDLSKELDDSAAKKAINTRPYMIYLKIKYAPSGDPTAADTMLYEGKIALDSVIDVVTTRFGKYQTIGAVKIKGRGEMYEPGLKAYKYVSDVAFSKPVL